MSSLVTQDFFWVSPSLQYRASVSRWHFGHILQGVSWPLALTINRAEVCIIFLHLFFLKRFFGHFLLILWHCNDFPKNISIYFSNYFLFITIQWCTPWIKLLSQVDMNAKSGNLTFWWKTLKQQNLTPYTQPLLKSSRRCQVLPITTMLNNGTTSMNMH